MVFAGPGEVSFRADTSSVHFGGACSPRATTPRPTGWKVPEMQTAVRPLILACLAAACAQYGCEQAGPPPATQPAQNEYNDQYVAALAAASDFCQAWQHRDEAAGRALLSRGFLRRYPDRQIRDAIVGAANPRHAAYEITGGERLGEGRYGFDVKLFYAFSGAHGDRLELARRRIVVVRQQDGLWKVDKFPIQQAPDLQRGGPIVPPSN